MIKRITNILIVFLALFLAVPSFAQDNRRLETKVADALAQFPAQNGDHTAKLMVEILSTGAQGIAKFCDMVVPPGTGNDTQARMALESLAQYAGAPNRKTERKLVESSILAALQKATDKEVKAFFIRRLQYCGGAETVAAMETYLNSADLYEPALAALTSIGTPDEGKAVLKAAQDKKDQQLLSMVKTLGAMSYQPAESFLIELTKSAKVDLLKHVYASLAEIGGKSSFATFDAAAKAVKYQYDPAGTMVSYIQYATRLAGLGETKLASQIGAAVLKNCTADNQLVYRSSALAIPGFGNNGLFLKEIQNKNKVYRNAVLLNAAKQLSQANLASWVAAIKKAPAETQAEIIHFLAGQPETEILTKAILPALNSESQEVRAEAIRSLAHNQKAKAVPTLLDQLKKAKDASEFAEIEAALLNTTSAKETGLVSAHLGSANDAAKVVLIHVLGARRATETFDSMMKFAESGNAEIKGAALAALATVAKAGNAPVLIDALKKSTDKTTNENIQRALIALYSGATKPDTKLVLDEIQKGGQTEKFIPVLSSLNDPKALKTVAGLLKSGSASEREAAFVSLSNWSDAKAAPHLFTVIANPEMKQFRADA